MYMNFTFTLVNSRLKRTGLLQKPTRRRHFPLFALLAKTPGSSAFREADLTGSREINSNVAEEDPFRPYAGPSYYAAVGVVDRARVSR